MNSCRLVNACGLTDEHTVKSPCIYTRKYHTGLSVRSRSTLNITVSCASALICMVYSFTQVSLEDRNHCYNVVTLNNAS